VRCRTKRTGEATAATAASPRVYECFAKPCSASRFPAHARVRPGAAADAAWWSWKSHARHRFHPPSLPANPGRARWKIGGGPRATDLPHKSRRPRWRSRSVVVGWREHPPCRPAPIGTRPWPAAARPCHPGPWPDVHEPLTGGAHHREHVEALLVVQLGRARPAAPRPAQTVVAWLAPRQAAPGLRREPAERSEAIKPSQLVASRRRAPNATSGLVVYQNGGRDLRRKAP
jgi:hypothetical protein